jgi:hypothetical protein
MRRLINKELKSSRNYERAIKGEGKEAKKKDEGIYLYVHIIHFVIVSSLLYLSRGSVM